MRGRSRWLMSPCSASSPARRIGDCASTPASRNWCGLVAQAFLPVRLIRTNGSCRQWKPKKRIVRDGQTRTAAKTFEQVNPQTALTVTVTLLKKNDHGHE